MTDGLTSRQTQLLKHLIDEYLETAVPIGSEALERKFNLGISPATIRNEMVNLTRLGFLKQPHTSAGRIPTPKAMKFYINQLMEERALSVADEVKVKEEVREAKGNLDQILSEATQILADKTKSLAMAAVDDNDKVWHAGYANLFQSPELLADISACADVFAFLEEVRRIHELFFERESLSPIEVIFGEELGWPNFAPIGLVTSHFNAAGRDGVLGVIGPTRLPYPTIIPVLKYVKAVVEEFAK